MLPLLLTLTQISSVLGCDIPERELLVRVAILKADQARQMHINGNNDDELYPDANITKKEFNKLIDSVKKVYQPTFKKMGQGFRIESIWEDKQENAFAGIRGKDRYVVLYGGYARHKFMTKDAFLSVICHEIGHHLGGFPRKTSSAWSSSEGQADYFSTLKCMKEVLKNSSDNESVALSLVLPEEVKKQCRFQHPKDNDYYICLRSAKAAEDHGRVIADLTKVKTEVSLLTPSQEVRVKTNLQHPDPQCRVDTKYQGALCNVSPLIALDPVDETQGTCHFNNFTILGNRPACWFVHKK